ncbi:hypothetical protein HELRODRAFT_192493 [Helobdella robusta]|uniref:SAM domain-containing protein n=1 Tax=Helobdella robusta TaxID=6412 RepID=T1FU09_HELRO|nr:hypothetical protein HELRODRAFT_192493 [Helobdella robusta]ESO00942.1 hypothetical protein HELRODRAFT_192493 [Helobdella robusta]
MYIPDGWLGILAGTKLYFDFSVISERYYNMKMSPLCDNNSSISNNNDINNNNNDNNNTDYSTAVATTSATSINNCNDNFGYNNDDDDDDDGGSYDNSNELFQLQINRLVREIGDRGLRRRRRSRILARKFFKNSNDLNNNNNTSTASSSTTTTTKDHRDDDDDDDGLDVEEQLIAQVNQPSQQKSTKRSGFFRNSINTTGGKPRADSGISTAEVASSIISNASDGEIKCQKCGALFITPAHLSASASRPYFSVSSTSPEFEDTFHLSVPPSSSSQLQKLPTLLSSPTPLHGYGNDVKLWSSLKVSDWLKKIGLEKRITRFHGYTGPNLVQMRKIQKLAPNYFYSSLSDHLQLSFLDVLIFSESLDSLFS